MTKIRSFIAVELSRKTINEVSRIIAILNKIGASVNWINPKNLHLTIKFLGNVEEDKLWLIKETLQKIANEFEPFDFNLKSIGSFPDRGRPRVIWVGTEQAEVIFKRIAEDVESEMEKLGFEKEIREFIPHLTLGRIKSLKSIKEFNETVMSITVKPIATRVLALSLFKSKLTPKGAIYTKLSSAKF